jgi:hypothetical protein
VPTDVQYSIESIYGHRSIVKHSHVLYYRNESCAFITRQSCLQVRSVGQGRVTSCLNWRGATCSLKRTVKNPFFTQNRDHSLRKATPWPVLPYRIGHCYTTCNNGGRGASGQVHNYKTLSPMPELTLARLLSRKPRYPHQIQDRCSDLTKGARDCVRYGRSTDSIGNR